MNLVNRMAGFGFLIGKFGGFDLGEGLDNVFRLGYVADF